MYDLEMKPQIKVAETRTRLHRFLPQISPSVGIYWWKLRCHWLIQKLRFKPTRKREFSLVFSIEKKENSS